MSTSYTGLQHCVLTAARGAQAVGDRCFQEGLFEPARAVFAHIPAWGRLASTLVRLHQFQAAVDAARKANSPKTWKEARARPPSWPQHQSCVVHQCWCSSTCLEPP